jgi:hypothetical protein
MTGVFRGGGVGRRGVADEVAVEPAFAPSGAGEIAFFPDNGGPESIQAGFGADPGFLLLGGELFSRFGILAFALQADAFAVVVAAADAIEGADEGEDALFAALGDGFGQDGDEEPAQGEGLQLGATVGEGLLAVADLEGIEFLAEVAEGFAEEFFVFPIDVAALPPFAEVLLGDGAALEVFGEDGFHFGPGVEPGEKGASDFAVGETLVEGFADRTREAADFAAAGGGGSRLDGSRGRGLGGEGVGPEMDGQFVVGRYFAHMTSAFVMRGEMSIR